MFHSFLGSSATFCWHSTFTFNHFSVLKIHYLTTLLTRPLRTELAPLQVEKQAERSSISWNGTWIERVHFATVTRSEPVVSTFHCGFVDLSPSQMIAIHALTCKSRVAIIFRPAESVKQMLRLTQRVSRSTTASMSKKTIVSNLTVHKRLQMPGIVVNGFDEKWGCSCGNLRYSDTSGNCGHPGQVHRQSSAEWKW
jgi:hypothetical protein